jgi:enterochelin esterase-like enzyme
LSERIQKHPSYDTEEVHIPGFSSRLVRYVPPPDHHEDQGKKRPVLLLFDGQNVFGDEGSFSGGWHVHRAVARLAKRRPRPIVVGLDHGHHARLVELSPFPVMGQKGRAEAFLSWVAHTLVPRIRARYAVIEGPAGILLGGASLGGLAATYAHFRWPEVFGGALAMSPSFWVHDDAIEGFLARRPLPAISQLYFDGGKNESKGGLAPRIRRVGKQLKERGLPSTALRVVVDPKGKHHEASWRRRMPAALRWFYRMP